MSLTFNVAGIPAPQGSKRHVGGGRMIESSKVLTPWRRAIAWEARQAAERQGWLTADEPVAVSASFWFAMPKSRPKAVRDRGVAWKTTTPDADKLMRALGDALKEGGIVLDDSRIAATKYAKYETTGWTGMRVTVVRLTPL